MEAEGYWFKAGMLFDISPKKHIHYICQYPSAFGLTQDEITSTYGSYNEKPPFEGKARAELIKKATKNGWIRIRHYLKPDYWSIQFSDHEKQEVDIHSLIQYLIGVKVMNKEDTLALADFHDDSVRHYSYQTGGAQSLLGESGEIQAGRIVHLIVRFDERISLDFLPPPGL